MREAILATNATVGIDEISFDQSLEGLPIHLTMGEIKITEALSIIGLGAGKTTIDAVGESRIFNITATKGNFHFQDLSLSGGHAIESLLDNSRGGAIRSNSSGLLTITGTTISGNSTDGEYSRGGGISARGDVNLISSTLSENSTTGNNADGGGIHSFGNVSLTNSTVSGNFTNGENANGGGISAYTIDLTNSTISGNFTNGIGANGGGISTVGDMTISSSIVAGNTVSLSQGPDLHFSKLIQVEHSLIGNNRGTSLVEAQTPDTNGNLIGSFTGSGTIDPLLGPLADNGGPTLTHALLPGSPAIDAGDVFATPGSGDVPLYDQRGEPFTRRWRGKRGVIDIGAFELQDIPTIDIVGDSNRDGHFNVADILQVLVAGKFGTGEPATFEEGDWNGDNRFDAFDIILALSEGTFEGGQQAAILSESLDVNNSFDSPKAVDYYYNQEEETPGQETLDAETGDLDSIELLAIERRR